MSVNWFENLTLDTNHDDFTGTIMMDGMELAVFEKSEITQGIYLDDLSVMHRHNSFDKDELATGYHEVIGYVNNPALAILYGNTITIREADENYRQRFPVTIRNNINQIQVIDFTANEGYEIGLHDHVFQDLHEMVLNHEIDRLYIESDDEERNNEFGDTAFRLKFNIENFPIAPKRELTMIMETGRWVGDVAFVNIQSAPKQAQFQRRLREDALEDSDE